MSEEIKGFSKLSKEEKIEWLTSACFKNKSSAKKYFINTGILMKIFKNYTMSFLKIPYQTIIYRLQ